MLDLSQHPWMHTGPLKDFMFSVPSGAHSKHLTEWLSHFCRTLGKQFPFLRTGE